jgi:hypothetical protein
MGTLILAIVFAFIAIVCYIVARQNYSEGFLGATVAATILCAVIMFTNILNLAITIEDQSCYQEYNDLIMLQEIIDNTDNETIRFNYYQRVEEYNKGYDIWKSNRESFWVGMWTGNQYKNCERIDFKLRSIDSTDG